MATVAKAGQKCGGGKQLRVEPAGQLMAAAKALVTRWLRSIALPEEVGVTNNAALGAALQDGKAFSY